jgi:hypothetical protein
LRALNPAAEKVLTQASRHFPHVLKLQNLEGASNEAFVFCDREKGKKLRVGGWVRPVTAMGSQRFGSGV